MSGPNRVEVVDLDADDAIVPVLAQDRVWAAYALCDLAPPHRGYTRYIGAVRDGRPCAVVLVYTPPGFTSLSAHGNLDGVRALLAHARDLPAAPTVLLRRGDVPALEARYRFERSWTMLRFAVTSDTLRPALAPEVAAEIRPLAASELPALQQLYALWPQSVFTPFMLKHGIYVGAHVDGALVAVAGTHAYSPRHGAGVIGNVFTHPEHRGRRLAAATTGAVAAALFRAGVREVALNVHAENAAAIAAYHRLGFALHEPFVEGRAVLR